MQVAPIKPTLKAPGTKRLKLKYDKLLSSFAFKFSLRRCSAARYYESHAVAAVHAARDLQAGAYIRPLFGSTFALYVGQGVFRGCLGGI